jgi:small subunit ribosomal protein S3
MGQKVHPHGFRVGIIKDWDSRWYARSEKVGDLVVEDYEIRKFLKKTLDSAGVPRIEIERDATRVKIFIHCARPGVIIGRGGAEIEALTAKIGAKIGKPVSISIVEVKSPDTNAQLVAEGIAQKLEKRIGFRRAMKNAMSRAMRLGVRGIKVTVGGRLGGAEIARSESYHEGTIPLQTLRADIDYGFAEAATTYGRIGVKVWVYNGEVLSQTLRSTPRTMDLTKPQRERRDSRTDNRGGSRTGGYQNNRSGGSSGGYQGGSRTGGTSGGYQGGNRTGSTGGTSGGYQGGNRTGGTGGTSGGYQGGNRTGGTGGTSGGYQGGNRTGGYQGNRPQTPRPQGTTPAPASPAAPGPAPAAPAKPTEGGND